MHKSLLPSLPSAKKKAAPKKVKEEIEMSDLKDKKAKSSEEENYDKIMKQASSIVNFDKLQNWQIDYLNYKNIEESLNSFLLSLANIVVMLCNVCLLIA